VISPNPWNRSDWSGQKISADGADVSNFEENDIAEIVKYGSTPPGNWDGDNAGIVLLKDGRYVGWESWWDCSGDGFNRDAYGGTSDIIYGKSVNAVMRYLSDNAKSLLRNGGRP